MQDLDFAGRRCQVKAKGARTKARRRGQAREDFVLETVYWDAGTARLLPRLLKGRTRGPVFVAHRRPGPGKVVSPRDVCPDTGLVVPRSLVVGAGAAAPGGLQLPVGLPPGRRRQWSTRECAQAAVPRASAPDPAAY